MQTPAEHPAASELANLHDGIDRVSTVGRAWRGLSALPRPAFQPGWCSDGIPGIANAPRAARLLESVVARSR